MLWKNWRRCWGREAVGGHRAGFSNPGMMTRWSVVGDAVSWDWISRKTEVNGFGEFGDRVRKLILASGGSVRRFARSNVCEKGAGPVEAGESPDELG